MCVFINLTPPHTHIQPYLRAAAAAEKKHTHLRSIPAASERTAWFITVSHHWWRCTHWTFQFLNRWKGRDLFPFSPTEHNRPLPKWKNIQSPTVLSEKVWQMEFYAPGSGRRIIKKTPDRIYSHCNRIDKVFFALGVLQKCRNYYHSLSSSVLFQLR